MKLFLQSIILTILIASIGKSQAYRPIINEHILYPYLSDGSRNWAKPAIKLVQVISWEGNREEVYIYQTKVNSDEIDRSIQPYYIDKRSKKLVSIYSNN